jgi:hypothetical protein
VYVVTLTSGIKHVDSHTQEASGLATIASPPQPNYTTAARAPAIAEQLTTAAVQFGGSAERDRLEVTKTQSPEMLERRFFLLEQHVRFVRDRLKRAGTRLARLLNTTLGQ